MTNFKVNILAFGAHPDDVECAAAGVLLKHIEMGKTVAIVDLTSGELGSHGTPENRRFEAKKASDILGISHREFLNLGDGKIENSETNRILVIEMVRKYQPDIILTNAIKDRHPDHAKSSELVNAANFLSGLKNIKTAYNGEKQNYWRANAVYNYIQDYYIEPDFVIDISDYMDKKMESILAYKSQFVEPKNNGAASIIGLLDQVKSMNTVYGRPINAKYAEGFTVSRYLGVNNFYSLQ